MISPSNGEFARAVESCYTVNGDKMFLWGETTPPYRAPLHRRGIIPLLRRGARRVGWSPKRPIMAGYGIVFGGTGKFPVPLAFRNPIPIYCKITKVHV